MRDVLRTREEVKRNEKPVASNGEIAGGGIRRYSRTIADETVTNSDTVETLKLDGRRRIDKRPNALTGYTYKVRVESRGRSEMERQSTPHEEGSPEITRGRRAQHRKLGSILSAPRNLRRQQDNNSVAYSALGLNELNDERPLSKLTRRTK
ncbi:hypothetical protein HZH66_000593 [Vespula vulgaris]|uniref:Uncharacterized protein n=1 Tax=Vespula vulgaris TaxID=7454 RepID=A0A834KRS2_VESVU|nr:hypothetical protein HZH66_000593 [Vespula vulgaris]